jgi:hypothetical protein
MHNIQIGNGCGPTGRLITQLLREKGVRIGAPAQGVVCYGVGYRGNLPALNANVGRYDKYRQFEVLRDKGVRVPNFYRFGHGVNVPANLKFPLFGRKLMHREGKDIMPALQVEDIPLRMAAGAQFFTEYIPRQTEIRVWVYRRRHLASYQKVMRHPTQYKYFGCSYRNGFAFELMPAEQVNRAAVEQAAAAVDALGLDFGAADVLIGKDGLPYVLEVNTAPGVEGARQSIVALADKIANWECGGYLRRNGADRA